VRESILIHYHEINLKRGNRGWFESRLQQHIQSLLRDLPHDGVARPGGGMEISLSAQSPAAEIKRRLGWVSGIANYAHAWHVPASMDEIRAALAVILDNLRFSSFRIDTRRGNKSFPLNSQQINEELGRFVQERSGAAVRLEHPELTCFVEITGRRAFIYTLKLPGLGGLPPRTGGRVLCLISGGIDSPIAAFRMMRRGGHVHFVHFHSYPQTSMESQDKVRRILQILSRYQLESRLALVPFGGLQREIVAFAPPQLRVLLYRRFMIRVSELIALQQGTPALVTGDSLGQVASQTMENLCAVSAAARLPLFRPLIGHDKEEVIRTARQIGTYEISILPDQDCCTMFVPRHPETMASAAQLENAEVSLDVPRLVQEAAAGTVHETIEPDFRLRPAGSA